MSAKVTVILYIILCLMIGILLTVLPWLPPGTPGMSDWGNNYFLVYATRKTGFDSLQAIVASGWVRGAVSGVGLLNFGIAFWEIFNFKRAVAELQQQAGPRNTATNDAAQHSRTDHLRDNERHDYGRNHF